MSQQQHEQAPGNALVRTIILEALRVQSHTVYELVAIVKMKTRRLYSETAISARCRDLRKARYGQHPVKCRFLDLRSGARRYEYYLAGVAVMR